MKFRVGIYSYGCFFFYLQKYLQSGRDSSNEFSVWSLE